MSDAIEKFRKQLHVKINDADKRLKGLEASTKASGDRAKSDAKAHLASIESEVKAQRAKVKGWEGEAWRQDKKITDDKIAEWKAKRHTTELSSHADRSENYAASATQIAVTAIDDVKRAIVEAVIARMDASSAQPASAAKSA